MVKKKVSGQTIAIIILSLLLLVTICFGGVYAYYSSRSAAFYGRIIMGNLKINLQTDGEDHDDSILTTSGIKVPGSEFENKPLYIINESNVPVYISIIYILKVTPIGGGEPIEDYDDSHPLISIGQSDMWTDYLFVSDVTGSEIRVRCLMTTSPVGPSTEPITVIGENQFGLSTSMGNEFQSKEIEIRFQAYAIGADSLTSELAGVEDMNERCDIIMSAIYKAFYYNFD